MLLPLRYRNALKLLACLCLVGAYPVAHGQATAEASTFYTCLRDSYQSDGSVLDSLMSGYEATLVELELLEGTAPADYRGLLQRIASGQRIEAAMPFRFRDRLRALPVDSTAWRACQLALERFRSDNPEAMLTRFLDRRDVLVTEGIRADLQASSLLDILGEAAFEHPFYRLQTYYLIDLQAGSAALPDLLPETVSGQAARYASRGANILRLYLNERTQTIVEDQLVSPERLAERVHRHAREFGREALYVVELELDVKYRQYVYLKDRIARAVNEVRDEYSRRVFGKTLTEASEAEKLLLENRFPIRVVLP